MQIALSKIRLFKYYLLAFSILLGAFIYWHLATKVCLLCPLEIPFEYSSTDGVRTEVDKDNFIVLFRGVHAQHPDWPNAKMGIATPIGGHDNPYLHNRGAK
jgi:hypothetical protein